MGIKSGMVEEVFNIISVIGSREMDYIIKPESYFRAIYESETLCCREFLEAMQDMPVIDGMTSVQAFSVGLVTGKRQEFIRAADRLLKLVYLERLHIEDSSTNVKRLAKHLKLDKLTHLYIGELQNMTL